VLFQWSSPSGRMRCFAGVRVPASDGDVIAGVVVDQLGVGASRRNCCRVSGAWTIAVVNDQFFMVDECTKREAFGA